jgi:ATP-dependent RNA helicase DDX59
MPATIQEYIHQIGRAGRLGTPGIAITFINDSNKSLFPLLHQMLKNVKAYIPPKLATSKYLKKDGG